MSQEILVGVRHGTLPFKPGILGAETGRSSRNPGQLSLHMDFQVSQGYTVRPIFKKKKSMLEVTTLVLGRHSPRMVCTPIFTEFLHLFPRTTFWGAGNEPGSGNVIRAH